MFLFAAGDNYAGAIVGFSILSADGRSVVKPSSASTSLYKPETGPAFNLFVGRRLSDYLSVEANYLWNSNELILTSATVASSGQAIYEERRSSSEQSVIGDLLLYFRDRPNWARPYLSVGTGVIRLSSKQREVTTLVGPATLPPQRFTATVPGLRVAVGIDLALHRDWAFRYSFSETMGPNPVSDRLSPPGERTLKNFQNLFGFVKRF